MKPYLLDRENDQLEKLKVVFVLGPALFHVAAPDESLSKFGRHVTLCGLACDGADFSPFFRFAAVASQPCERCVEEFKAAREVLGMVAISASWVPLKGGDTVTVCNPESERFKEKGEVTGDTTWDLAEGSVYVKFKSFWSALKYERRELRLIIQP